MNSPQSQKLAVGSIVRMYVQAATRKTSQPVMMFAFLYAMRVDCGSPAVNGPMCGERAGRKYPLSTGRLPRRVRPFHTARVGVAYLSAMLARTRDAWEWSRKASPRRLQIGR